MRKKKVIIIGGGASNLIAADMLSTSYEVHIFEKGKGIGRKFLVAGNGGFNLTNSATDNDLLNHYSSQTILREALNAFDSHSVREWLLGLGIETFVGSSGRIFPIEGIKPIHVLQKIKDRLIQNQVQFHFHHEFISLSEDGIPTFKTEDDEITIHGDYYIFGLGGASWSKTGSDGKWIDAFQSFGIKTVPFQSSNCGINIDWPNEFQEQHNGSPLKNIKISIGNFSIKGEALITQYGMEGNAIYPCIPFIRTSLSQSPQTYINIDLKPNNSKEQLLAKIKGKSIKTKNYAYEFKLNKMQLALIKNYTTKEEFINPSLYINAIKNLKIPVDSLRGLEESISTVGGIHFSELNADFSLQKQSNIFLIGEMLDWDAPTGGFLLQACFSTAVAAARAILKAL